MRNNTTATVNIKPLPIVTITNPTVASSTVCSGSTILLHATGGGTYQWSSNAGSATTYSIMVNPTSTTIYSVNVIGTNGCTNVATYTLNIISNGSCRMASVENINRSDNDVSVFPNPASGIINLQSQKKTELGNIIIYNSVGAILYEVNSTNSTEQIDTSELLPGMYIIKAHGSFTKLIKE